MHCPATSLQLDGSCLKQEQSLTQREYKSGTLAQVSLGSSFNTTSSSDNSDFSEAVNPGVSVVLRLECVSAKTLKKIFIGFSVLRWTITATWLAAVASVYIGQNGGTDKFGLLVASAAVGAVCTATLCVTLTRFWTAVLEATRAQQKWTQRRSRLVTLTMLELVCLALSNFMLTVSSGFGSTRRSCHLFTNCGASMCSGQAGMLSCFSISYSLMERQHGRVQMASAGDVSLSIVRVWHAQLLAL
ncbi:TPA: hypothetical protein ACH3X2_007067 [Trebouxia sp. C0005]